MPNFNGDDPWARINAKLDQVIEKVDNINFLKVDNINKPPKKEEGPIEIGLSITICTLFLITVIYMGIQIYNSNPGLNYINSSVHALMPPD